MPTSPRTNRRRTAPQGPTLDEADFRAVAVRIGADALTVTLPDGREVAAPYTLFPRLANATPSQRKRWRFIGNGEGMHWPSIDEHISVFSIVHPELTIPARYPPPSRKR